jgi:hypothetical protein
MHCQDANTNAHANKKATEKLTYSKMSTHKHTLKMETLTNKHSWKIANTHERIHIHSKLSHVFSNTSAQRH